MLLYCVFTMGIALIDQVMSTKPFRLLARWFISFWAKTLGSLLPFNYWSFDRDGFDKNVAEGLGPRIALRCCRSCSFQRSWSRFGTILRKLFWIAASLIKAEQCVAVHTIVQKVIFICDARQPTSSALW